MKIIKYNVPKASDSQIVSTGSSQGTSSDSSSSGSLSETHLIFGQPFNGTQDVAGDISNAENITTSGGDITVNTKTDSEGTYGGNIVAGANITATGDITGNTINSKNVYTDDVESIEGIIKELSGVSIDYESATFKEAVIDALNSTNITTDYLTVTKQAHFFELIIDKIKAAGGAVLLTPADGFKVDKVVELTNAFKLYWKATDGDKKRSNMWKAGDQAVCQTFNAAEGTSYNVSNKYYWSLVL